MLFKCLTIIIVLFEFIDVVGKGANYFTRSSTVESKGFELRGWGEGMLLGYSPVICYLLS